MPKPVKKTMLGFRADDIFLAQIKEYLDHTDLTAAQMFRRAVQEYIEAHPMRGLRQHDHTTTTTQSAPMETAAQA